MGISRPHLCVSCRRLMSPLAKMARVRPIEHRYCRNPEFRTLWASGYARRGGTSPKARRRGISSLVSTVSARFFNRELASCSVELALAARAGLGAVQIAANSSVVEVAGISDNPNRAASTNTQGSRNRVSRPASSRSVTASWSFLGKT